MSDDDVHERLTTIPGECPTPLELGVSGWNILHSSAAVYPYKPSSVQQTAMRNFIESWAYVYACSWCAYHMREYVRAHPPDVRDKLTVSRYVCEMHNNVNERLGKELFDCTPSVVLRRWHPGYPNKMEDTPTIEEQLAASNREKSAAKDSAHHEQEHERRFSGFGLHAREAASNKVVDRRDASEAAPRKVDGGLWIWRIFRRPVLGTPAAESNASPGMKSSSPPPTAQHEKNIISGTRETPPAGAVTAAASNVSAAHSRHSWGATSTAEVYQSAALPTLPRGKAADDETDIDAVLKRLKRCQVYCPEDEELKL
uniref:Sulfhydryl oxidase n=1 Tax=Leishmania tarentolae TaxID=5689 RepID=G9HQ57_LEITA|nr:Erv [Leishmania tarentolae]